MGRPHGHNRVYDQRGRLVYEGPFQDGKPMEEHDAEDMDAVLKPFSFMVKPKKAKPKDKL